MSRNWMLVLIAGCFEVIWVIGLKHSYNTWTMIGTLVAILISFDLLIRSSARMPVGTVYAVFTGIGTAGTVLMEMTLFGEPFQWTKVLLIMLLLAGVIGLKMITKESETKGEHS